MITVYRFAHQKYNNDLTGTGAKIYGGRWNDIGIAALYTSYTISLALVELFIHKNTFTDIVLNQLLEITVDAEISHTINYKKLKSNWKNDVEYCRYIGSEILLNENAFAISVPSAIIEQESNVILNPTAKDFNKKVKIKKINTFEFDERLFKK